MLPIIATGKQSFLDLRQHNYFYIDKTRFIKDWWNGGDDVTLITRPRRFGKTLMLDTVRTFFGLEFAEYANLFDGLEISQDEHLLNLQGSRPVIFLSLADVKANNYLQAVKLINARLVRIYNAFSRILDPSLLLDTEKEQFKSVCVSMDEATAQDTLLCLSEYLVSQKFAKPIILLDEYDTPLQEAWFNGYFDKLVGFMRGFFNSTFKTNTYLGRGLITGITRIAKESIFSDMNNLKVVSITSDLYSDCFGFTEQEVYTIMDEYGLTAKEKVKSWYDGFIFGKQKEIYNPWSIIGYLTEKKFAPYWAHTSSNALVGDLIAHSDYIIKKETEQLLLGESIKTKLNEEIVFSKLYTTKGAIWSLLMAAGYVKPISFDPASNVYEITLTNHESYLILEERISAWFGSVRTTRDNFQQALLEDDLDEMNELMSNITENIFSYFDTQNNEENQPENFYHAFILGLIVNLKDRYIIRSNRESGLGRYDICMFPNYAGDHGIIIEFKTMKQRKEKNLEETCSNALKQIKNLNYIDELLAHKVSANISIFMVLLSKEKKFSFVVA